MGKEEDKRPKALIIGTDFSIIQIIWGDFFYKRKICVDMLVHVPANYLNNDTNQTEEENEILNVPFVMRRAKDEIQIGKIDDLEKIIPFRNIERCFIFVQNLSINCIKSIVYRIMAVGSCIIEYLRPKEVYISSCKPIVSVSSLAKNVGKTPFIRYCARYLRQYRKVAVIIPIVQLNQKILDIIKKLNQHRDKSENQKNDQNAFVLFHNDERPNFEFLNFEQALQQKEWLSDKILQEIKDYFQSGAFCVYVTANLNKALMQAERRAHIIFYDSFKNEIPLIKTKHQVCVVTSDTLLNIEQMSQWPGLVNLNKSKKIVFIAKGKDLIDENLKLNLIKMLKKKPIIQQNISLKSKQLTDEAKEEKQKFFFVNCITKEEANAEGLVDIINNSDNIGINSNNNSSNISLSNPNANSNLELNSNNNLNSNVLNPRYNEKDYSMNIVSLPQDIVSFDPNTPIVFPTIYDCNDSIHDWLSSFFITLFTPPLQAHFESQVGIIMSMDQASEKELCVTNHTSANRGALCRLFLQSHLPSGYRVTNGEILDAKGNSTGQLEVVIVNDSAPYMTIGANNSVIAPILADTVLCVVEVKTLIDPENLRKALSQLRPVKALMPMHGTLEKPDGEVIADPLGGKILTGIFGFNMNNETIDQAVPEIVNVYPNVVDFIVIPNRFGYFLVETLKVCGIDATLSKSKIVNGYVRFDADGIELALIFGILNSIAAIRRFSGSNCVRYLSGKWENYVENKDKDKNA